MKDLTITCSTSFEDMCNSMPKNGRYYVNDNIVTAGRLMLSNQDYDLTFKSFDELCEYLYADITVNDYVIGNDGVEKYGIHGLTAEIDKICKEIESKEHYADIKFIIAAKHRIIEAYKKYGVM